MIRIAITAEAFAAIERMLPGNAGFEREPGGMGERWIWLEPHIIAKLKALRGPGESYSDVILRIAAEAEGSPKQSSKFRLPDNCRDETCVKVGIVGPISAPKR